MLHGLTYTTHGIKTQAGYDFGHVEALIRSPDSEFESIWEVDTSHAAGGKRKHAALIHELAQSFIARAALAELRDDFRDFFEDGRPAIFLYHDGGEDPSEEPTKVVCIDPKHWRLMGSEAAPWCVCYTGTVFDVDGQEPPYYAGGFWNDAWMRQISLTALEDLLPDVASRISERFPRTTFSEMSGAARHKL